MVCYQVKNFCLSESNLLINRLFNGRDEHGTVMPSESSYRNGAVSRGKHKTTRKKDVVCARKRRVVKGSYALRNAYFK